MFIDFVIYIRLNAYGHVEMGPHQKDRSQEPKTPFLKSKMV